MYCLVASGGVTAIPITTTTKKSGGWLFGGSDDNDVDDNDQTGEGSIDIHDAAVYYTVCSYFSSTICTDIVQHSIVESSTLCYYCFICACVIDETRTTSIGLNVKTPLFVGGVSSEYSLPDAMQKENLSGFSGCVSKVSGSSQRDLRHAGYCESLIDRAVSSLFQVSVGEVAIDLVRDAQGHSNVESCATSSDIQRDDPCLKLPCGSHGVCVSKPSAGYTCVCEDGYQGMQACIYSCIILYVYTRVLYCKCIYMYVYFTVRVYTCSILYVYNICILYCTYIYMYMYCTCVYVYSTVLVYMCTILYVYMHVLYVYCVCIYVYCTCIYMSGTVCV